MEYEWKHIFCGKFLKIGHECANPIPMTQKEPKRKKVAKQVWQPKETTLSGEVVQGDISIIEAKENTKDNVIIQKEVPWNMVKRHSTNVTPTRSTSVEVLPVKNGFISLDHAQFSSFVAKHWGIRLNDD
ncbi:hypothetical protein HAX54_040846 [Datura stramonium]|uniref:Uncharacterized protein n=1 Tax=Datura stramonium TaxID=4076 RepID=A0ABS8VT60_DATST|nr:hypothetical protein [Datura stramonium]